MNPRSHLTTKHTLLTRAWTAEVETLETAVGRLEQGRPATGNCRVAFFEVPDDDQLHVNVTHEYRTKTAKGWAGPATLPDGFVHNRRFGDAPLHLIARHIREMVLAERR